MGLYNFVQNPNAWTDIFGLKKSYNGNDKRSSKKQHGYEIYDANGNVVKTGVSSGRVKKDGTSARADKQVRDWNNKKLPGGPFRSKIVKNIPPQQNARQKILNWEEQNANRHRSTLDPDLHKRP